MGPETKHQEVVYSVLVSNDLLRGKMHRLTGQHRTPSRFVRPQSAKLDQPTSPPQPGSPFDDLLRKELVNELHIVWLEQR